jgi:hypothetical protein
MTHWQVKAHPPEDATVTLVFGVSAADPDTARDRAAEVLGNRTALLELREIPPPEERGVSL